MHTDLMVGKHPGFNKKKLQIVKKAHNPLHPIEPLKLHPELTQYSRNLS